MSGRWSSGFHVASFHHHFVCDVCDVCYVIVISCHFCLAFEAVFQRLKSSLPSPLSFTTRWFELCRRLRRTPWGGHYCWWSLWASPWWRSWWLISTEICWGNLVLPRAHFGSWEFAVCLSLVLLRRRCIRWSCSGAVIGNAAPLIALFFK